MAMKRVSSFRVAAVLALILGLVLPAVQAQAPAPAPAPAVASDGTTVDQGIAYVLMLVALLLTYLIHPYGASTSSFSSTSAF